MDVVTPLWGTLVRLGLSLERPARRRGQVPRHLGRPNPANRWLAGLS